MSDECNYPTTTNCKAVDLLRKVLTVIPMHVSNGMGGIAAGFQKNPLYEDIKHFLDQLDQGDCSPTK